MLTDFKKIRLKIDICLLGGAEENILSSTYVLNWLDQ